MTPLQMAAVAAAGFAAGAINTIVGSGSLITFPTLLALGLPPVQSAQDAVKAALVAQVKNERKET